MAIPSLTSDNVLDSTEKGTHVLKFYAEDCGPCNLMAPKVDMIMGELEDDGYEVTLHKIDTGDQPALAHSLGVIKTPTILVIRDGELTHTFVGIAPYHRLKNSIKLAAADTSAKAA